ncbi:MAG: septum formation initiator family protein [Solibacillus sp.]|uniref:FtsB family cell division protein n=1 Tax=unclassified Solibacillus TaxID=2637870 RepID=UPI003100BC2F
MGKRNMEQELHNNVQPLDNDFVRSNPNAKRTEQKARKKVLLRRRLAIFLIFGVVIIVGLAQFSSMQSELLIEKEQKKLETTVQLEEVLSKQELLNLQIAKLEDDEYIAKLARKEFFLSEEGEIIFTMPKATDKENIEQKKSDEKQE